MNQTPPPGFYPDPDGVQRWWDGSHWTEQIRPVEPPQQQFAHGAPQGRSKLPWIVGGVVLLLVVIVGGVLTAVLMADDSDGSSEAAPEDTVQAYFDALAEDDCEGMVDQVTDRAAEEPSMNCDTYDRNSMDGVEASNEILDTDEDGDEATVDAREKFVHPEGTYEAECDYELVKEDDEWLIDDADCDRINE